MQKIFDEGIMMNLVEKWGGCKWNFRDEPSSGFREFPAFRPKSDWKPPPGHSCVEWFLS